MAYCSNCGKPLEGSGQFCRSCGSPVPEQVSGAAAAPPSPPGAYPQGGAYPPGGSEPPKAGRSLKWLWSGLGALVVVVAVVCVLVFVVFNHDDGQEAASALTTIAAAATTQMTVPVVSATAQTVATTTSTTETTVQNISDPQKVVLQVFDAMENQDAGALLTLMDPAGLEGLPEGATLDAVKAVMAQELAKLGSMKFSGIEMVTEITSDTTATVTLTAGVVTVTDTDGQTTSEDVKEAASPVTVDLIMHDGTWYMESTPFL
ncbi:MAG TPA: zinc ribbon domain-containing protein [Thermoleophilia bacterium]